MSCLFRRYYEPLVKKAMGSGILEVTAIVLANLCVSYIMTSQNEDAEELMRAIEREEERVRYPARMCMFCCAQCPYTLRFVLTWWAGRR